MPTSGAYCLVMGVFAQLKKLNKALPVYGDGSQRRDFTYVKDVVQANILASTSDNVGNGEIINIGNGDNKSIQDIADIFGGPFDYKPKRLEPFKTLADNTKARELLDWKPTGNVEQWLINYLNNEGLRDNPN
jgi:UDP-glucose 4-epimerase